jgi:hypothetical protein
MKFTVVCLIALFAVVIADDTICDYNRIHRSLTCQNVTSLVNFVKSLIDINQYEMKDGNF